MESQKYAKYFADFSKYSDEKRVIAGAVLKFFNPQGEESLLDIGAGNSDLTDLIAPHIKQITCIEKKEEHVKILREKYEVYDMDAQDFEGENFDCILASHMLYGVPQEKWAEFVERIANMGKKTAIILFGMKSGGWFEFYSKFYEEERKDIGDPRKLAEELKELLGTLFEVTTKDLESQFNMPLEIAIPVFSFFCRIKPERKQELETYLQSLTLEGNMRMSAHHVMIMIERKT